jgi:hypothetical protein
MHVLRLIIVTACLAVASLVLTSSVAMAHPADELCGADGGMDPALCRALQEMDRADSVSDTDAPDSVDEFDRPALQTFGLYVKIGTGHILPGGLDHILFVLALFLSTRRLRPLLLQISAFTAAHTLTLGLVAAGVIAPPAGIVEPLIAATIAFVAIENMLVRKMTLWRPFIVLAFGLVHGMGFAGYFGTLGLPSGQFWSALIGFNVGVEVGQLSVLLAAALLAWPLRHRVSDALYRRAIVWPFSGAIGLTGLVWTVQRILAG